MAEHTKGYTPGPWSSGSLLGWGGIVIMVPSDPKPIASMIEREGRYCRHITTTADGVQTTRFAPRTDETDAIEAAAKAEVEANGRLIASAPELLEALWEAEKALVVCRQNAMVEVIGGNAKFEGVPEILAKDIANIRAARAKAEGK